MGAIQETPLFLLIFLDIAPMGKYNRFGIVYAGGRVPRVYYNPASTEVCVFTPFLVTANKIVCGYRRIFWSNFAVCKA